MAGEPEDNNHDARIRVAEIVTRGDVISRNVQVVSKWLAVCVVAYFVFKSVEILAISLNGKVTIADIRFEAITRWFSNSNTTCTLSAILGVAGIFYGRIQSNLKKDAIERLHPYQEKYENLIDRERSSSLLTKRGDTRPEDK